MQRLASIFLVFQERFGCQHFKSVTGERATSLVSGYKQILYKLTLTKYLPKINTFQINSEVNL